MNADGELSPFRKYLDKPAEFFLWYKADRCLIVWRFVISLYAMYIAGGSDTGGRGAAPYTIINGELALLTW